jgi:hypothetical protein
MKKNSFSFLAKFFLVSFFGLPITAAAQACYPKIIVGFANDTTTIAYDDSNHITSITDPFAVVYLVQTNDSGSITSMTTGAPGTDDFYKATYTYDSKNNLIHYEAHKGADSALYWTRDFTYNSTNQLIQSYDGQYNSIYSYPSVVTKNPSRISIYLGDPKGGILKQTATLTYDNRKRMSYRDLPQYYLSPFATNNVVSITTTVDFYINAGKFTYEYNPSGYPTSTSFAGTIHTDKDGNTNQMAFTERYTYYCK